MLKALYSSVIINDVKLTELISHRPADAGEILTLAKLMIDVLRDRILWRTHKKTVLNALSTPEMFQIHGIDQITTKSSCRITINAVIATAAADLKAKAR